MPSDPMIRVMLAEDNVIVREGVRVLLCIAGDVEVFGVAGDYDELLAGAAEHVPQVAVTDIRMPLDFTDEAIRAARVVRKRSPGTGW
jgi:DNA-binding NarL/FixJ family response regulator